MYKIKQILRCFALGMGLKSISETLNVSRNTVRRYVRIYQDSGMEIERLLSLREEHLREMFYSPQERVSSPSPRQFELEELLPEYARRLRRRDTTRATLYAEYSKAHL